MNDLEDGTIYWITRTEPDGREWGKRARWDEEARSFYADGERFHYGMVAYSKNVPSDDYDGPVV